MGPSDIFGELQILLCSCCCPLWCELEPLTQVNYEIVHSVVSTHCRGIVLVVKLGSLDVGTEGLTLGKLIWD